MTSDARERSDQSAGAGRRNSSLCKRGRQDNGRPAQMKDEIHEAMELRSLMTMDFIETGMPPDLFSDFVKIAILQWQAKPNKNNKLREYKL